MNTRGGLKWLFTWMNVGNFKLKTDSAPYTFNKKRFATRLLSDWSLRDFYSTSLWNWFLIGVGYQYYKIPTLGEASHSIDLTGWTQEITE